MSGFWLLVSLDVCSHTNKCQNCCWTSWTKGVLLRLASHIQMCEQNQSKLGKTIRSKTKLKFLCWPSSNTSIHRWVLLNFGTLHLAGKQGSEFWHFLNHFLANSGENICCGTATIRRSVRNSSAFLLPFWSQLCLSSGDHRCLRGCLFVGCNTERRSCSERFNQCSYYWLTATDKKKNNPRRVFTP